MEVGEHCSEQTCKRLGKKYALALPTHTMDEMLFPDFLPFTCQNCKGIFW